MFYRPSTRWSWCLVIITVIETSAAITLESIMYSRLMSNLGSTRILPELQAVLTSFVLLVYAFTSQSLLLYDTLAKKNVIQLYGLSFYAATISVYTGLQIPQNRDIVTSLQENRVLANGNAAWNSMSPFLLAASIITALYTVFIALISIKLTGEFAWSLAKQLNADLRMQKRYFTFQIYITLLKFDAFFSLGFLIQFAVQIISGHAGEFILLLFSFPVTFATLFTSAIFMRRENLPGMIIALSAHVALLSHTLFKFTRMYQPDTRYNYRPIRTSITFFGVITIVLEVATIAVALMCVANFKKGLKPHISGSRLTRGSIEDDKMELSLLQRDRTR